MIKRILLPALAFSSLLIAAPDSGARSGPSWESLGTSEDFLTAAKPSRTAPAMAAAAAADIPDGGAFSYAAWKGPALPMRQFNGRYTALVLRQADLDAVGIARVRKIIDEQDIVYEAYRTLVGVEPAGAGLLQVAIIDSTCGAGCGWIGSKGIELNRDVLYLPDYLFFVIHEMGHNYDNYSGILYSGPDIQHSWTMFFDNYVKLYLGLSFEGMNAPDFFRWRMRKVFEPYETFAGASWSRCISAGDCDPDGIVDQTGVAMGGQGGLVMRIVELYGSAAITPWLANVRTLLSQRASPPVSDLDKEEFFAESLAMTLKADLSCFFDQLNWPVGSALRGRLARYGAASAFCADADFDGYTRLRHDCNDASAAIRPGAVETLNGTDDDCDGVKDDPLVKETAEYPHDPLNALTVPYPVRVTGNVPTTSDQDIDCLRFDLPAPDAVRITLISKGIFDGYLQLRNPVTGAEFHAEHVYPGDLTTAQVDLPAGRTIACLYAYGVPGAYELDIAKGYAYPMAGDLAPVTFTPAPAAASSANRFLFPVPAVPAALAGRTGLTTHFWISGFGEAGSIASNSASPFQWTAPAGSNPMAATYRVDFAAGGIPVHPWSQYQSLPGPVGWTSQDIGNTALPGSLSRFGEQDLSVQASGADIWGTSDGFRFTYLPLNGNGEVTAKLLTLANTNSAAKAGVMIRESLLSGSRNAFMGLMAGGQADFQTRAATGGATVNVKRAAAAPLWVKLSRNADVITASTSADGSLWTVLGAPVSLPMAANVFAGIAVTSHNNALSTTAGFANATVVPSTRLPSPWVSRNVGSVGPAGDASITNGVLTVNASGADIWGAADAFRFVYFPVNGNAQLIAKVTSLQNTNAWAKAGVMIRESLSAGSSNAFMAVTPASGATFQSRIGSGAVSASITTAATVPKWVRITRVGSSFTGYVSDNGTTWTQVGSKTIPMAVSVYIGVALTSHNNAVVSKLTVQDLNPN
ncbi:MAG: hypothetical protein JWP91_3635 [Fibrobacteres bacterium]|nr:hypothetical protein [Fibrobacterota bacterium]